MVWGFFCGFAGFFLQPSYCTISFHCKKKVSKFLVLGGVMTVYFWSLEKWLTVATESQRQINQKASSIKHL